MGRKTYSEQCAAADILKGETERALRDAEHRRKSANEQFDDMFRDVDYREWQVAAWHEYKWSQRNKAVAEKDCVTAQAPSGLNSVVVGASPLALEEAKRHIETAMKHIVHFGQAGQSYPVRASAMDACRMMLEAIGHVDSICKGTTATKA